MNDEANIIGRIGPEGERPVPGKVYRVCGSGPDKPGMIDHAHGRCTLAACAASEEETRPNPEHERLASLKAERDEERDAALASRPELPTITGAEIVERAPAKAGAAVFARQEIDECDSMTDYYATRSVGRSVFLGYRNGKRESFPALRKCAAIFEPTADLGPGLDRWSGSIVWDHDSHDEQAAAAAFISNAAPYYKGTSIPATWLDWYEEIREATGYSTHRHTPTFGTERELAAFIEAHPAPSGTEWRTGRESVEHRENYSMGRGNYLKGSGRYSGGWFVQSEPLTYVRADAEYDDATASPVSAQAAPETETPAASGVACTVRENDERDGVEIVFSSKPHAEIRDRLKSVGFRWSRHGGCWYKRRTDAVLDWAHKLAAQVND